MKNILIIILTILTYHLNAQNNVYICQLGDVDNKLLVEAKKAVENNFNYNCEITHIKKNLTPNMFISGTDKIINAEIALNEISDFNRKDIYIYLTNKRLWIYEEKRGVTYIGEKTILINANCGTLSETIVHEIGHTYGLRHCSDRTCVMAINNDDVDSGKFCSKCSIKLPK